MSEEIEENVRAHEKYLGGLFYGREEARAEAEAEIAEAKAETAEAKAETAKTKAEAEQKLKETQTLIVKNLLNENMTDLKIMEIANISKEELDNIKNELK